MGNRISHQSVVGSSIKRLAAMKKYVTDSKLTIPVGGKLLNPAQVAAIFQSSLDTQAAVAAQHAAYKGAMADRDEAEDLRRVADEAMKNWILQLFGDGSTEATEFGYAARRKPEVSAEARAKAVELNRATREARGTKGKKEKLKIRGRLPASVEPNPSGPPAGASPPNEALPPTATTWS
jgi:hypothetical protein